MTRFPRRLTYRSLAALVVLGLLPGAVLAAAPVAVADTATTAEDTLVTITVVGHRRRRRWADVRDRVGPDARRTRGLRDADCSLPDPDACSAEVEYTPASNYNGPDSFTFVADDGNGGTDDGQVASR